MMCRLLIDSPGDGAWNMAVDEALLEAAARENRLTLRCYGWSEPTLSLGYFQRYEDRRLHAASVPCACVRRATGGGAILHDRELTYSLAVPPGHPLAKPAQRLYELVHGSLAEYLRQAGVEAVLVPAHVASRDEPFLCFQRRVEGDVVLGSHKIAGSAQRRWQGAVLQHGSILLETSIAAPELPGLSDLSGRRIDIEELQAGWLEHVEQTLGSSFSTAELSSEERHRAGEIARARYGQDAWTRRR